MTTPSDRVRADGHKADGVRVRFAPAPTGHLHVGGARTALFNWLFARRTGGDFILRIDDTDRERSTAESLEGILDTLRWLGLDWDEGPEAGGDHGPYLQSMRSDLYREAAEGLREKGLAYRCYCTREDLDARRKSAVEAGRSPAYDRRCRDMDPDERQRRHKSDESHVLRFAAPLEGDVQIVDLIRGEVKFEAAALDDFVLVRADGNPTFSLAGAFDDYAMGISHIARGEDLLSVTPRQVLLSRAFGRRQDPVFAHLPLIVGADRSPLSKRHGDVAVGWYRDAGFVPEALVNYLALLGWGPDAGEEILDIGTIASQFALERVSRTPAMFDLKKLDWMNNHYLQSLPSEVVAERGVVFLREHGLIEHPPTEAEWQTLARAVPLVQVRIDRLAELPSMVGFLLRTPEVDAADWEKVMSPEWAHELLAEMVAGLAAISEWETPAIEAVLRGAAEAREVKARLAFGPIRVAVSGVRVGPPLFESLELLGREAALDRAQVALFLLEAHGAQLPAGRWPLSNGG